MSTLPETRVPAERVTRADVEAAAAPAPAGPVSLEGLVVLLQPTGSCPTNGPCPAPGVSAGASTRRCRGSGHIAGVTGTGPFWGSVTGDDVAAALMRHPSPSAAPAGPGARRTALRQRVGALMARSSGRSRTTTCRSPWTWVRRCRGWPITTPMFRLLGAAAGRHAGCGHCTGGVWWRSSQRPHG